MDVSWNDLITDYLLWLAAAGATVGTRRLRAHYLRRFAARHADPALVTLVDLTRFLACSDWSAETRKSVRSTLRSFYRWAVRTGRLPTDPTVELPPVRVPAGVPRPAPDQVLAQAFALATRRERLMLELGAYAGLRRAEIAAVHTRDLVGDMLRVVGKGGQVRVVPLPRSLVVALRTAPPGWLFPSPAGGHLSPGHVGKLIGQLLERGWSAHTLRHRYATKAYAVEYNIRAVQMLLGHRRIDTTTRYTAVVDQALRRAAAAAAM